MKGTARTQIKHKLMENLDTIDLSTYENINDKFLEKQVGECTETGLPIIVRFESTISHKSAKELAPRNKKSKKVETKETPNFDNLSF